MRARLTPVRSAAALLFGAFLPAFLPASLSAQQHAHDVVGYYPSWKWHTDAHPLMPRDIPFEGLTIINYAFFVPSPDGTIRGKDSVGDAMILGRADVRGAAPDTESLTALAHRRGVRVFLSIGGWDDSDNFPLLAASSASRAAFAHSCAGAIREYRFDGIDIDWEFPGYADHRGTPADADNFALLLRTLRDTLRALPRRGGRQPGLSAALPAVATLAGPAGVRQIAPLLDFVNVMTYDFYGTWDERAFHNAPLYASPGGDSAKTVEGAFRLYHDEFGIPASRINLGVPFYGHTFTGCTELLGTHGGADTEHFPPGGAVYTAIAAQMPHYTVHWDARACVPYLTGADRRELISYDDAASVRAKAEYVLHNGIRGLIIWEITGDALPDGSHPLLAAIDRVLHVHH